MKFNETMLMVADYAMKNKKDWLVCSEPDEMYEEGWISRGMKTKIKNRIKKGYCVIESESGNFIEIRGYSDLVCYTSNIKARVL